jgi:16S rRNA (guanine527-N7)-methyltransferase
MSDVPAAFRTALSRLAEAWHVACGPSQAEALSRFAALLLTWNARINLTGANSLEDVASDHLPDSFALAARFDPAAPARVIDVGSGGGLPALPLAVLRPSLRLRLIEPIAKKAAFLRTATRELGLGAQVTVHVGRVEPLAPGDFDAAFSRATFSPESWARLGVELIRPGGRVFVLASMATVPKDVPPSCIETFRGNYLEDRRCLIELTRSEAERL